MLFENPCQYKELLSWMYSTHYIFGFNGFEKDDEIKGSGNWYAFGDYGYDPRVVQRPSPNPKAHEYPSQSPYLAFNGNPLYFNDQQDSQEKQQLINKQRQLLLSNI